VLHDWGLDEIVDTVCLLTSELATNAVLHARTAFAVVVSRQDGEVRIDVLDGSGVPPRQRQNTLTAATGRGVAMVARLASTWGATATTELQGFAKGVWFTVPVNGVEEAAWDEG
jgi:two-component sensor histidine kinase